MRTHASLSTAARTWVTTKEEMHGTIDGLCCIMLEAVFEINCGNLRRAWAVYRRAMTVAQLMGIHRSPIPPLRRIDPELDAKPDFMWLRIVYMDRYLSLLLGLPQGTTDKSMVSASVLRHESPVGVFERQLTVIASRVLEHNESPFSASEIATGSTLLRVSKSMPASFWRPANFHNLTPGSPDTLLETVRLSAQVYYYGLLIQLHLPYMMQTDDGIEHEYSKITCVNASRDIMTRFIAHRSFKPMSSCSRPVDFFALLAAMTLLLAHLDAHQHGEATNFLAHQRLSDRAMLDQALDKMTSDIHKNLMTGKSAKLIRKLLSIEADAADGSSYTARSVIGDADTQEGKEGEMLHLLIPYRGTIKVSRQGPISRKPSLWYAESRLRPSLHVEFPHSESFIASPRHASPTAEQVNPHTQVHGDEQTLLQDPGSRRRNVALQSDMGVSPIAAEASDWAFQGVDTAFFDSLMREHPTRTILVSSSSGSKIHQRWLVLMEDEHFKRDAPTQYARKLICVDRHPRSYTGNPGM
ncbi:putative Transcription factor domain-containing protein [Seiridium cardinale]|uniref:Transcription factor domain-containing protein n=1 Tax=Seiridium cardinale TaxID=138064 RepID=A0ABR2XK11_9PEZI